MSYFDPGDSPTTTNEVFFDTDAADLAAAALDRLGRLVPAVALDSDPVTTTDSPASVCGAFGPVRSSAIRTPAAAPLVDDLAVPVDREPLDDGGARSSGRRPSTPASSSWPRPPIAVQVAVRGRQRLGRGRADVPDRQRDEHPPQRPGLGLLQVLQQLAAFADSEPALVVKNGAAARSSAVEGEQVALVGDQPVTRAARRAALSPSTSMSNAAAPGQVEQPLPQLRRAGPGVGAADVGVALLLRRQLGPAGRAVRSASRTRCSLPSRSSTTGPRISGITSPALRSTTVSPISTPLRAHLLALCSVASSTVEPATRTGSITPYGVTRPVRPTLTWMSSSLVLTSSGGYLNAIAQRGARAGRAEPSLHRDARRPSPPRRRSRARRRAGARRSTRCTRCTSSSVGDLFGDRSLTGSPQRLHRSYAADCRVGSKPSRAPNPCTTHPQRAARGDPRVLLPQRPGGGVARVGERRLARPRPACALSVGERLDREEHLAADLQQRRARRHRPAAAGSP